MLHAARLAFPFQLKLQFYSDQNQWSSGCVQPLSCKLIICRLPLDGQPGVEGRDLAASDCQPVGRGEPDWAPAPQATFATIREAQEAAGVAEVSLLNFAVSDGATLIATRYVSHAHEEAASLYYAEGSAFQVRGHAAAACYAATIVAHLGVPRSLDVRAAAAAWCCPGCM